MSLFNSMIRNRHFLTTTTKKNALTVLSGKESSMARKVPSLCSVLMMITALILAVPAQAELQLFFVHNDHLSTPKYLTDTTGKAIWQAQATPFGEVTEKEDLDGDGKYVTLNMRFPGQYWDHEAGTSYNYFRDYDPSLGRYIQSDPIGLGGGINTYAYVEGNPLSFQDPLGLDIYQCDQPLHALESITTENTGRKNGPDSESNLLHHEYLCTKVGGKMVCGGQDRGDDPLGGKGKPSNDKYKKESCDLIDESEESCMERCVSVNITSPYRPNYELFASSTKLSWIKKGYGQNCQSWVSNTLRWCKQRCSDNKDAF